MWACGCDVGPLHSQSRFKFVSKHQAHCRCVSCQTEWSRERARTCFRVCFVRICKTEQKAVVCHVLWKERLYLNNYYITTSTGNEHVLWNSSTDLSKRRRARFCVWHFQSTGFCNRLDCRKPFWNADSDLRVVKTRGIIVVHKTLFSIVSLQPP